MEISQLIEVLDDQGTRFATALTQLDPGAPVPSCPDWQVRDLVAHTGTVHRWARGVVTGQPVDTERVGTPSDADLVSWFRDGHRALVGALRAAPDSLDVFTFLEAPSPRAFWARRQAHETAIHRVDVEGALGTAGPVDPAFAADGIDEMLRGFGSRPKDRTLSASGTLAVRPDDQPGGWLVEVGPERLEAHRLEGDDTDVGADGTVSGSATDLYYALWNRPPLGKLRTTGNPSLFLQWTDQVHVRWG